MLPKGVFTDKRNMTARFFCLFHFDVELEWNNAAKTTLYREIVLVQFLSLHRPV